MVSLNSNSMDESNIEEQYQGNDYFDELLTIIIVDEKKHIGTLNDRTKFKQHENKVIISNINFYNLLIKEHSKLLYRDCEETHQNLINTTNTWHFKECVFKEKIIIQESLYKNYIFENCKFEEMIFEEMTYNEGHKGKIEFLITDDMKYIGHFINNLIIKNSNFNNKFYINNQKTYKNEVNINSVSIKESKFYANFKLHNCIVDDIVLNGVDFNGNADFFKSIFGNKENTKDIIFSGINFDKLVIFEECVFKNKFTMEYCTFESLGQFRNAIFKQGLDLDRTNILKDLNFYGIKKLNENNSKKHTSQETYKIVKYYSEKNGSVIQANKYHALELEKKRIELNNYIAKKLNQIFFVDNDKKEYEGSVSDLSIFLINRISSNFGTSWILALFWIFIVGTITNYFMPDNEDGFLHNIFTYVSIANIDIFKEHPIIFFFNKIGLGYLYYQFVTAVRKDTRK